MTNLQKLRKAEKKLEQIEPSALTRLHLAAAAVKAAVEAYPQEQGTRHLSWWTRLTTSIPRTYSIDPLIYLDIYQKANLIGYGPTIFADEYPLLVLQLGLSCTAERAADVDQIIDLDGPMQYQLAPANLRYAFETALWALNAALIKKGDIFINTTCIPSSIAYNTNNGVWQTMKNTVSHALDFALLKWKS